MIHSRVSGVIAIAAPANPAKPIVSYRAAAATRQLRRASMAARAAETSQDAAVEGQEQQQAPKDEAQPPAQFSVELPTADVHRSVQLMSVLQGRGAAIVVSGVQPGSAAAAAGLRCGQQLLAVSDPVRRTEMWELNPQASLRYTRQAIRMRVADSIVLRLTAQPIPEWAELVESQRAAAAAERAQQAQQDAAAAEAVDDAAASGASVDVPDDLLTAIVQAAEAQRSGSSFDEASFPSAASTSATAGAADGSPSRAAPAALPDGGQPATVAERLEAEYAARQAAEEDAAPLAQRQLTDLERRQRRRKEYFEQASQRNDAPFFATMAAAFVVPPALILGIAWASGYLDTLDAYSLLK